MAGWTFAGSRRGYENLWHDAGLTKQYQSRTLAAAKKIIRLKAFYDPAEAATGYPWWWIGCVHFREGDNEPKACLANGELIIGTGRRTVAVPSGRGPYKTFTQSAVDALKYEGLIGKFELSTAWLLYAAEKINGLVGTRNSNYIWAGTTKQAHGMWVKDHVFNPRVDDPRPGVAAVMKKLFEIDPSLEPKT